MCTQFTKNCILADRLDRVAGFSSTGGIFYCRDSADLSVSTFNKPLFNLTGMCFEIGNKNIPPNRYASYLIMNDKFNLTLK